MRNCFLITVLLLISVSTYSQRHASTIDGLKSNDDVEKLVNQLLNRKEKFTLKPISQFTGKYENDRDRGTRIEKSKNFCKQMADSLNITNSYYKADFDNNGYTDLLAIGDYYDFQIYVVMNYGDDSLRLNRFTRRSFQECTFPKIINDTLIRYYFRPEPNWQNKFAAPTLEHSDLVFKFGDFVEYNAAPKQYSIEKIEYQTTMCFGTCPKFNITISKDRAAVFKAEAYNRDAKDEKTISGTFTTQLKDDSYSEIVNLLNYLDFPNLKNNYAVGWTDDQTCTLKITYDNGKVKTIEDYGLIGTYGLDRLYQLFFELRYNQDWKQ